MSTQVQIITDTTYHFNNVLVNVATLTKINKMLKSVFQYYSKLTNVVN